MSISVTLAQSYPALSAAAPVSSPQKKKSLRRLSSVRMHGGITMIGTLPDSLLHALLETIPIEFSVLDNNDRVLAWNKHDTRIFKRPASVIGRNVRDCHPKKSLDKVEQILEEMKEGKRDKARFWINLERNGKTSKALIEYYALRDPEGTYLGCLEASQDITGLRELEGERRLLE
ncbi:MAG: PAS domain-containing protein [Candidatus Methanofastidiosia archaeon]